MSGVDLHPEELIDRVRRGQASAAERERVQQHLLGCDACRFEHALLAQSARDAAPQAGDAARARRNERAALAALVARGVLPGAGAGVRVGAVAGVGVGAVAGAGARRRVRFGALIVAGVVSSLATAAAAAVITQPAWLPDWLPALSASRPEPAVPARPHKIAHARKAVSPKSEPALNPAPVREPEAAGAEPPARVATGRPQATRVASELFAAANAARREREPATAVRLYRELLRLHPRSDEAHVARVTLGRLLLDRLGDARGALREFDAYLDDARPRALREDALIGKALALQRLGRAREERAAWKSLLAAFPASVYADRARTRLQELRCTVEPC